MIGGKLLATGSSSCIFHPNFPCHSRETIKEDKITKIIYDKKSLQSLNKEKKINEIVQSIPGYQKWSIVYDELCKTPSRDKLYEYDKEGMYGCEDGMKRSEDVISINESYMLNGRFGGITLDNYFKEKMTDKRNIQSDFLSLMNMMKPLFLGLKSMGSHNLIHNDIKGGNIVKDKNTFKYIDFGLTDKISRVIHFKKRSISEFKTNRIYLPYSHEYIYSNIPAKDLYKEINFERRNLDRFMDLCSLFNRDYESIHELIIHKSTLKTNTFKDLIRGIDTYSLGVLIPLLFLSNYGYEDTVELLDKYAIIDDFFYLFEQMNEPLYEDRISSQEAYHLFSKLVRKYNPQKKRNKTKRKKRGRK
uniref:Protein kinase domain-containing protein n=1 Tax=viral metagenome TaxID=1070528 RepID=A0A6C0L0X5_9ZZZZ|tara:strand:- start:4782 stop:5861 length:1080 start_codon:yes stop_codon:yes gene_type:complete